MARQAVQCKCELRFSNIKLWRLIVSAHLHAQTFNGTVGGPLPLLTFRLEAVPEMGYDPLADPPRGEIIIKGPVVFQGYYKVPS